jgi:iron complex outermembrane receptor protein
LNTARGFYDTNLSESVRVGTRQQNYAVTLSHEMEFATLTSITSYDFSKFDLLNDADLGPAPFVTINVHSKQKSWTQELQLASARGGRFDWVAGLFYFHSNLSGPVTASGLSQDTGFPVTRNAAAFTRTFSEAVTDSYAAYGQASYTVAEGTRLTAGLRYTKDKRYIDFARSFSDARPSLTFPREKTGNGNVSWRLAVDQKLNENILTYASYSRGFKSGLFNATNPGLPPVQPQVTDAYEVGLKSELFDRRLRANISAFQNDVSGLQLRGIPTGVLTPIFYNAANARFRGVDFELAARPVRRLDIQANVAYLKGRYGNGFNNALFFTQRPVPPGGFDQGTGNASGNATVYSPEWVAGLTAQYEIPTSAGEVKLTGSYTYNDGFFFDPQNRVAQPAYELINASINWTPRKNLELRLWANNITKERYFSGSAQSTFGDQYWPGTPRTYGISAGWSFGK